VFSGPEAGSDEQSSFEATASSLITESEAALDERELVTAS
jgi:hypothetical protein